MPWVHGDDYMKVKNAELKHLLILRHLPYSGTKKKMAMRLTVHDDRHPFPFQKLPPELRNKIYKLAATSQDEYFLTHRKLPITGHTEGPSCFESFENLMVYSSLFRASKQTRAEGLLLFYQHHCFVIFVEHGGCLLALLLWLRNIGAIARRNIRHLRIRYMTRCCLPDVLWMERISAMLSDQATVVYIPTDAKSLWDVGKLYYTRNPTKEPVFSGDNLEQTDFNHWDITDVNVRPPFDQLSRDKPWMHYSLVFLPPR